jgi:hypothetical protein
LPICALLNQQLRIFWGSTPSNTLGVSINSLCRLPGYILIPEAIYWGYSVLQSADGRAGLLFVLSRRLSIHCLSILKMCSSQFQNYGVNKDVVFIKRVLATPGDFIEVTCIAIAYSIRYDHYSSKMRGVTQHPLTRPLYYRFARGSLL